MDLATMRTTTMMAMEEETTELTGATAVEMLAGEEGEAAEAGELDHQEMFLDRLETTTEEADMAEEEDLNHLRREGFHLATTLKTTTMKIKTVHPVPAVDAVKQQSSGLFLRKGQIRDASSGPVRNRGKKDVASLNGKMLQVAAAAAVVDKATKVTTIKATRDSRTTVGTLVGYRKIIPGSGQQLL
jgi:hypothetical protein